MTPRQESWLRLTRSDTSGVENLGGWLTTVVARVCLDILRARKARREESLGTQVSEPIVSRDGGSDPEHEALLADSVGLALLVVLETLTPAFSGRVRFAQPALVDGSAGAVWAPGGLPRVVFAFTIAGGRIVEIDLLADPARLRKVELMGLSG